jgi:hypothetical protein
MTGARLIPGADLADIWFDGPKPCLLPRASDVTREFRKAEQACHHDYGWCLWRRSLKIGYHPQAATRYDE